LTESNPDLAGTAGPDSCPAGHPRPPHPRGGWICPRCGLRVMPLTATACFEGHLRPADLEPWTLWICPEDAEVVVPGDLNRHQILDANIYHPLFEHEPQPLRLGDAGPSSSGLPQPLGVVTFDPQRGSLPLDLGFPAADASPPTDPNDSLITICAPILAGFSLAAIVGIGTTTSLSGRPAAAPAIAFFAGAAVLLLFAMQVLAISGRPGLAIVRWPRVTKRSLYELGLLAFLAGLGLFLWPRNWSGAAIAGVAVVGITVISDLVLLVTAWLRRNQWGRADREGARKVSVSR
jgi:hypothetical protein